MLRNVNIAWEFTSFYQIVSERRSIERLIGEGWPSATEEYLGDSNLSAAQIFKDEHKFRPFKIIIPCQ